MQGRAAGVTASGHHQAGADTPLLTLLTLGVNERIVRVSEE